ncbi:MAG: efflux RND transporter periplasmic adaptor subunit [Lachnospiraceae bacterium]|nr:efflux RND transporter periplasmic adaptor subunit [Lachnospiraceae bacterium]
MGNETVTKDNDVMKTLKKREKSKKKRIILIVVLAIVVFLGVNIVNGVNKATEAMEEMVAAMQTGEVATRSLIKSVGATGTITSIESKSITAAISGVKVEDVLVEIGDTVTEGQELLIFDTTDIEESLANAKKTLSNSSTVNSITKEEAKKNLDKTIESYDKQIENAKENFDIVADALGNFDKYFGTLIPEMQNAKKSELEARLEMYQEAYEEAVKAKESAVESAENTYTKTTISLDTTAQKKQVELYEDQLAEGIVTAPISGIVTAVNFDAGDSYIQGSPIVTIQDCSSFEVAAYIGEYDISDIAKGQKVLIKTDATGDVELEGTVVFVSPTAATSLTGGDVTYLIRISVDTPNDRLRLDMSASLSIIIEQHENVLTVPYNAVQEDEQGNTYVEIMEEGGTTTKVPVTVVLESNYYTEIKADALADGQKVRVINADSNGLFDLLGGRGGF